MMRSSHTNSHIRRFYSVFCTCALLLSLWLGHWPYARVFSWVSRQSAIAQAMPAQDLQKLVQNGVNLYQLGEFSAALQPWELAYEGFEATKDLTAVTVVSENIARAYQQLGQTAEEIHYWQSAITATKSLLQPLEATSSIQLDKLAKLAGLLAEQAQAYNRLGQTRRAISLLCGIEVPDIKEESALTSPLATPLATQACRPDSALQLAKASGSLRMRVIVLGSLAEAYRLNGELEQAQELLKQGKTLIGNINGEDHALEIALANSLGNTLTEAAQENYRRANEATDISIEGQELRVTADDLNRQAIKQFEHSFDLAAAQGDIASQVRALLSLIPAAERMSEQQVYKQVSQQAYEQAYELYTQLPDSQLKALATIQLADFLESADNRYAYHQLSKQPLLPEQETQAIALLEQALDIGRALNNPRIISFAWGKLGTLDERAGRYEQALEKTQKARLAADDNLAARDSLYLWEWQLARILRAQGKIHDAERAYEQTVNWLNQVRTDLSGSNRDRQLDFRDTVEPIYRRYAQLNLEDVPEEELLAAGQAAFEELDTALVTLDSLKVAELQNYFADDCVLEPLTTRVDVASDNETTAVLNTAILPIGDGNQQKLTVILSLPDGQKKMSQIVKSEQDIFSTINNFRLTLESGIHQYISEYNFGPSQRLYNWLIRPFEEDLVGIETLVFVNDGLLRSVPMAALHDGEHYLIEQFAMAIAPSLTLTSPEQIPRPTKLSALLMGVSQSSQVRGQRLDGLPDVGKELDNISRKLPNSKILVDEDFSIETLQASLEERDYRILHMATHGNFGFDPQENFLVAGAKQPDGENNETLTISELDALIRGVDAPDRAPIELLTLTACETAIGSNRATLGLAGVAVRAGVRSAIATLWSVPDDSSAQLSVQFYENLGNPELTKAQALQQAQLALLRHENFKNHHPYRWAPYTLIGNWL